MKTKLLLVLAILSFSTSFHAQSIQFTSATLSEAEIGTSATVEYQYTVANDGYIYCAIELLDGSDWQATVADAQLDPTPAGTEVTGSFTLTIPEGTTPTSELIGNENYKIKIELSDANYDWLAGDYPATEINLTNETLSTNDIELQDKVKLFYANQKINVSGLEPSDAYELKLYDLTGREVRSFSHTDAHSVSLPSSLYIVKLQVNKRQSVTKKIAIP